MRSPVFVHRPATTPTTRPGRWTQHIPPEGPSGPTRDHGGPQLDESLRRVFAPDPADAVARYRAELLCQGDPEALLELYDEVAPAAYGWALTLTKSRRRATEAVRRAFLAAATDPQVFCNHRISSRGWILLEIHHILWTQTHPSHHTRTRRRQRGIPAQHASSR